MSTDIIPDSPTSAVALAFKSGAAATEPSGSENSAYAPGTSGILLTE